MVGRSDQGDRPRLEKLRQSIQLGSFGGRGFISNEPPPNLRRRRLQLPLLDYSRRS